MKKASVFFLLTLCCFPASVYAGPLSSNDFSHCADLQGAVKAENLYQVHLPEELITKAGAGFEDLRLFDASGKETPLTVIGNVPPHETIETYPLEIIGYDNDATAASVVMKLPQKHRPVNVLDLDIGDRDFKKGVSLSKSVDGKTWSPLAEDSIYDFSSQVNVRKTRMEFTETDAQFLRIKIIDLKPQQSTQPSIKLKYEGLDFSVNGVQNKNLRIRAAHAGTGTPAEKKPVYDHKTFNVPEPFLDKDGNTVIVLPAGLPLDIVSLDVRNPYFHRAVNLYGSGTGTDDSYGLLASQVIYRFPLSAEQREERTYIERRTPKQAFYKIVILNRNNPPLEVKSVTLSWIQQNLYFIALKSNERYSLCCGNTHLKRPDYDIVSFVNKDTLSQHPYERLELSAIRTGSGPQPTLRERLAGAEKALLTIIVVLLVTGMGWWLFALMKKKPEKK